MVGYLYCFHPSFQKLKNVIRDNIIGKPYYALFRIGGRGNHRRWVRENKGGGAMMDMMVHMLDLSDWYFGEPEKIELLVYETILKKRIIDGTEYDVDVEDFVLLRMKNKTGVNIVCQADLITPSYMNVVEVHGDNGSFFGSIIDSLPTMVYCNSARILYDRGKNIFHYPHINLFEKELEYFVESLMNKAKPVDSVATSIRTLRIIEEVRNIEKKR